ncbi:glycohydrolase toxin TNT-related protein [Mycobacteroides abscessus]|uniref:glycohydrolase toxin TNT-related protein n=1 Tax=Mycobacteroides abscessus TaxID=36809 RepID=UPI0005E299A6|nr:glycohydrolase toxin TNT-related protein [Mycobacteroides abscessus]CPS05539.1 Hypothetical protein ERS075505_00768 [Mycobacteroides abscessus]CPS17666.1 Hypothetical protein ERS075504_01588 [Mycobacteroides abscessus]CPS22807.1 Hypothetical protein ERS075506_01405 [Mycobacteroides abscessus]CPS90689.1 Hypothetical protein ERS075524_00336 [Mycobacteroides abscessus]CPT45643.1 Hypothetical protein ERS075535_01863 [Mycobacteroides abscessus]
MSLSVAELKKVSVASIRDISAGLRAKAASLRATKAGVTDLPHKGTWTGVAADNADHEIGTFAKGVGNEAEAYEDAARKVDRAGDEFEGLKQLLTKLENEAAGKFSINEATGEVGPLTKDFNKADRDYIAATIKQLCAAGGQANDDLAAGIHATDASGATSPAGAGGGPLALTPNSSVKPDGVVGGMQNLVAPNPEGDPGATKAAAATAGGTDTINYKELYPKTTVDGHQLGSVGAMPGVGDIDKTKPAKLAPTLADRDVPAFKDLTRQNLINAKVPADQIEQRVNDAVKAAQAPRFLPDADPMRTPGEVPLHNSPGDQFNDIVGRANDEATKTIDGQIEQAKILTGQAGPGAPGVAEAWKDVGLGAAQQLHELTSDPLAAPKMGIEQAKDFYQHPGEFIGKNLIHGTEALAGGAVGGEAAAGARGLLGDLTGTEARALTHDIPDSHHAPTPPDHPSPHVDHPTPTGGDHGGNGTGGVDFGGHSPGQPTYSSLPDYAQQALDRATDNNALRQDLINHGVPPDIANSAQHNPYAGLTHQDIIGDHYTARGGPAWPPHDGFANGKWESLDRIPENVRLDRIGEVSGSRGDFMATQGDSYPSRALAPGSSGDYHTFQGTGKPLRNDWELRWGEVGPAFGQPGGGTQWVVVDKETGDHILVDTLIRDGYLR